MEKEYDSNDFSRLPEADIYAAMFEAWGDEDGYTDGEINAYRLGAASWDDELNSLAAEVDRLLARVRELEAAFGHYHKAGCESENPDACARCGFDLRDAIHFRAEVKA